MSEPIKRRRGRPTNAERAARAASAAAAAEGVRGTPVEEEAPAVEAEDPGRPAPVPPVRGVAEEPAAMAEVAEGFWTPGREVFINLKGKLYLPARRRIQWMRGEPVPHPEWTIDTDIVEHQKGRFVRPGRVEDGYATLRANIFNEDGRLIATGLKTEYSENFADYLEKAETGAIARALAVAGYGTETALDLDEGLDKERIADSPVAVPGLSAAGIPDGVSPSAVTGVGRGGRTSTASAPQIARIAELSRELGLDRGSLLAIVSAISGAATPELAGDDAEASLQMTNFLRGLKAEVTGQIIDALQKTLDGRE